MRINLDPRYVMPKQEDLFPERNMTPHLAGLAIEADDLQPAKPAQQVVSALQGNDVKTLQVRDQKRPTEPSVPQFVLAKGSRVQVPVAPLRHT